MRCDLCARYDGLRGFRCEFHDLLPVTQHAKTVLFTFFSQWNVDALSFIGIKTPAPDPRFPQPRRRALPPLVRGRAPIRRQRGFCPPRVRPGSPMIANRLRGAIGGGAPRTKRDKEEPKALPHSAHSGTCPLSVHRRRRAKRHPI
jgi:hypothetical protein